MKTIRIGSGAGYAGDRLEPSLELIEKGNLDYISYECLAERTIAIGQQAKLKDPTKGYNGLLEHRMEKALPLAWEHTVSYTHLDVYKRQVYWIRPPSRYLVRSVKV